MVLLRITVSLGNSRKMRAFFVLMLPVVAASCGIAPGPRAFSEVGIEVLWEDSISIRALEVMPGSVGFAGSDGLFGTYTLSDGLVRTGRQGHQGSYPEFRAAAHTATDFFMLSAGDPALLYKTGDAGQMELVYREGGPGVFYDAMAFWDNANGLAVGDARDGCMSILLTRDGGHSWARLPCDRLPPALPGEGAFAASNTNIAIAGSRCWVATTKGRIFRSDDLGRSWQVIQTPVAHLRETQGIYSIDFYDAQTGFALGGDYTRPDENLGNKARTSDGGKNWQLVAEGSPPGYKSCVRFVPGTGGEGLVAVGFTGIAYSRDGGISWSALSDSSFYTLGFANDSIAYAAGKGRLARLTFR